MALTSQKAFPAPFTYRRTTPADFEVLLTLVRESWPADMQDQVDDILRDALTHPESTAIFACFFKNAAIGYAQVCVRQEYVEGALAYPIAYLEALHVKVAFEDAGIAQHLIQIVTAYVNSLGIEEIATDCASSDLRRYELFLKAGFEEVSQLTHFVKSVPRQLRRS